MWHLNHLQVAGYLNAKTQILSTSLTVHSCRAKGQPKQHTAIILKHSLLGCESNKCALSSTYLSFYLSLSYSFPFNLPLGCSSSSYSENHIKVLIPLAIYFDAITLCATSRDAGQVHIPYIWLSVSCIT